MKKFRYGEDVCLWKLKIYGIIVYSFYPDEYKNINQIVSGMQVEKFKGWRKKPIYEILCYSDKHNGERFLVLHDMLVLTGDLN